MTEHDQAPEAARADDATSPYRADQPTETLAAPGATAPHRDGEPTQTFAAPDARTAPTPVGWSAAAGHGTAAPHVPDGQHEHPPQGWAGEPLGPQAQNGATTAPRRPAWVPLVGTAAATALLTSLATAGLTGAFDRDLAVAPVSLADIGQTSSETVPVSGSTSDRPDWEAVASAVSASVVAIQVTTANGGGEGSGVVLDDAGHILTNDHVVSGAANDTVQVTLTDGRLYDATIVGLDPSTDLAVIKIDDAPDDLTPAALGDSEDVVVGAPVMAVGNPLGLANTVTTGIVSAVDRPVSASSGGATSAADVVVTNAIQIDAAINPGNSGGPLFDAQGRVVGITSSIATLSNGGSQAGSIGLGFAIPVNLARGVAAQLVEDGAAEHAFLGVSLSDGTATADGVTRRGAVVEQVTAGSPAESAALQTGDVIVAIDGDAVAGSESLTAYVRERSSGDSAELTIVRGGEVVDVTVTLATRETAVTRQPAAGSGESSDPTDPGAIPPFDWFGGRG